MTHLETATILTLGVCGYILWIFFWCWVYVNGNPSKWYQSLAFTEIAAWGPGLLLVMWEVTK
jgi:hypothetical protein